MMLQVKLETATFRNSIRVPLTHDKVATVSRFLPDDFFDYVWIAVKWNFRWYAYSYRKKDGTRTGVSMHRLLANTPPHETCHHLNGHTLDNRDGNFLNMTFRHHKQLHGIRRFGRKKKVKATIRKKTTRTHRAL